MVIRSFGFRAWVGSAVLLSAVSAGADMASPTFDSTFLGFEVSTSTAPTSVVAGRFTYHSVPQDDVVYLLGETLYYLGSTEGHRNFWDPVVVTGSENKIAQVYAADVTGDGYDDLVALGGLNVYVFKSSGMPGVGALPFGAPTTYAMAFTPRVNFGGDQAWPTDIDFGDFDGDGDVDLVVALQDNYYEESGGDESETVTYTWNGDYVVSLNQGGGNFATTNTVTTIPDASSISADARGDTEALKPRVAVGDYDGDGKLDLAFGFNSAAEWLQAPQTRWYRGNGNGTFAWNSAVTTGHVSGVEDITAFTPTAPNKRVLAPGYKADLALAFETNANVLSFSGTSVARDTNLAGTPRGPLGRAWELNGDGLTDLVFADGTSSTVLVGIDWTTGNADQRANLGVDLGTDIQQADVGDFDADGRMDLVGLGESSGKQAIWVNYNNTPTNVLTFYSNNGCTGSIGYLSGATNGTYDLTVKDPVLPNDEARSMALWATRQGTTIKIYDDGGGDVSAGWSEVTVTTTLTTAYCLPSFQLTQSQDGVSVTYTVHTDHSADKDDNDVDGKVSRIVVTVP